jgi:hypothetical protein
MVVPDVGAKTRHGSAGLHLGPSNVDHIAANSPDVTLQLVAIARAALAWSESHDEALGAAYMSTSLSGGDFGPQRERYQQAIAALVAAIGSAP